MPQRRAFSYSPYGEEVIDNVTTFLQQTSSLWEEEIMGDNSPVGVSAQPTVGDFDRPSVVLLAILYTTITVLAVVGNTLTIAVFSCGKKSSSELSVYLINLACADFIMALFCLPFTFSHTLLKTWVYPEPLCPAVLFLQASCIHVHQGQCASTVSRDPLGLSVRLAK